jgi:drug/metabolite transporter (DMT)-like permease
VDSIQWQRKNQPEIKETDMKHLWLYVTTVLVWGSTWLAITYQLGSVDPMVSVCYRFGLAGALLVSGCLAAGRNLRFSPVQHGFMALQGVLLFSVNYWFVYMAETRMASGLVAVVFSTIVFFNVLNGYWILKAPVRPGMVFGAVVGMAGVCVLFLPEIRSFSLSDQSLSGIAFCLGGVFLASLGNITSARNQKFDLPVLQTNGFGMIYGSVAMAGIALLLDKPFTMVWAPGYLLSLGYLAVFGSILAFGCYLTLVGRIGPDRASYAIMLVPGVALVFSSLFESYRWTAHSFTGLALVMAGNLMVLREKTARGSRGVFPGRFRAAVVAAAHWVALPFLRTAGLIRYPRGMSGK